MDDFRLIADRIAAAIAAGRLRPGDKLEPQRRFARRHRIAASTAARVYGELVRRGLAVGEVGRGTFVRASEPAPAPALTEPTQAGVDLEQNVPILPEQPALIARALHRSLDATVLAGALTSVGAHGTARARTAAADLLARAGWAPDRILFAGNGRQAIAATIAALVRPGERLGVEAITYPVAKAIAAQLGVAVVPIDVDEAGLSPDALRAAAPLKAVYLQTALHNPLGVTMPAERRGELVATLHDLDLVAIEDGVYAFLAADQPPLAALAPDRTILVDSASKRLAPGLTAGFVVPPARFADQVAAALRSGGWGVRRFPLMAVTQLIEDGTLATIESAKRTDAAARQSIVREKLEGFAVRADPRSYHCWWELPSPWRAETFVAAAARRGIAVTPAAAFTTGSGHAPNAVRLALSTPPPGPLAAALDALAALARNAPDLMD